MGEVPRQQPHQPPPQQRNRVVVWDTEEELKIEIENFKEEDVNFVVVEHIPGSWKIGKSSHEYTRKDAFTIEYHLTLPKELPVTEDSGRPPVQPPKRSRQRTGDVLRRTCNEIHYPLLFNSLFAYYCR